MPWVREGDGLKLTGVRHFATASISQMIKQLRSSRKGQPEGICGLLEECLEGGTASKQMIWRLSKWCDWRDSRESIAREIAYQLFYGMICRRLLDQQDKAIPNAMVAEADYQTWIERVSCTSNEFQRDPVFPDEVDQADSYFEGTVVSRC